MKMVAEYLEHAHRFEGMAGSETNPLTKKQFEDQAQAYYKLAIKRAKELGLPAPHTPASKPPQST